MTKEGKVRFELGELQMTSVQPRQFLVVGLNDWGKRQESILEYQDEYHLIAQALNRWRTWARIRWRM